MTSRHYYAATNLNERYANSGKTARQVIAFASRALRDRYVANYPTPDCEALGAHELSRSEREEAQNHVREW